MPYFDVSGYGRDSGRRRQRRYRGKDEDDAINAASADGTVVESISRVPAQPATERQIEYARDLGLSFPDDISVEAMSDLLDRHLSQDELCPAWLSDYASQIGLYDFSEYVGKLQLFSRITRHLDEQGNVPLAEWFIYHVCRDLARCRWDDPRQSGIPADHVRGLAEQIASDPRVMKSIRRYSPSDLLHFGDYTDDEGWMHSGASRRTLAYKAVAMHVQVR
jgi:hypothetical protein